MSKDKAKAKAQKMFGSLGALAKGRQRGSDCGGRDLRCPLVESRHLVVEGGSDG
jgi:hypothetical protein